MKPQPVLSLLEQEYGCPSWQLDKDPIAVLVLTILSQNTSDANSHPAFARLVTAFPNWAEVARASVEQIASSIESGGLAKIKAKRIKAALQEILHRRGSLTLDFLLELPLPEAKAWLQQLPGVGAKTAACVLLFSLGSPALPVDTHIYRVARRLGLVNPSASAEKAADLLEKSLPPQDVYPFHILLIEHGRRICRAIRPRCHQCVLQQICPRIGTGAY